MNAAQGREPTGGDASSSGRRFFAPLGSAASGRLVFGTPVDGLDLLAAPDLEGLARARFEEGLSWIVFETGLLMVAYRPESLSHSRPGQPAASSRPVDEIALNASIPWEVEFRGPAARVTARLGGLQLRSLDLLGEASQIALELTRPAGAAYIYLAGGARQIGLRRPAGVGVAITAQDGVDRLVLDGGWFRSLEPGARLESLGFDPASGCYEISLTGQASQVRIELGSWKKIT